MATNNPATISILDEGIQGIILRTSATFSNDYTYFSIPCGFPYVVSNAILNNEFTNSLTTAPHFPNITILDSIPSNILYHTYNSFSPFFHVYNLMSHNYFPISFPYPCTYVNATIIKHERFYYKILVVCMKEHPNHLFDKEENDNSTKPLIFYVYSSKSKKWSCIHHPSFVLISNQLLSNRRKPIHTNEDVVYLDLTDRFLIRFSSMKEDVDLIPKLVSSWEKDSIKLDETTQYGVCRGWLHCAKINPIKRRVEIYIRIIEPQRALWRLFVAGKEGSLMGKVVGLHPNDESVVFIRSEVNDEILMVDIQLDLQWVVIGDRGEKCGQVCFLKGMNDALMEVALEGGEKLQHSSCVILNPHENIARQDVEIFFVSFSGKHLDLK